MFLPSFQRNASAAPNRPLSFSASTATQKPSSTATSSSSSLNFVPSDRPTVLFLGTDDVMSSLVQKTLEPKHSVIRTRSVKEVLPLLEAQLPDLILCDLQEHLPTLLEAFQAQHLADIPFLLFTSHEERHSKSALLSGRVTDLVMKPCESVEISARIRGHLQNYLAKKVLQNELRRRNQPLEQLAQEISQRAKELNRINKLKDEFMAVLSHELRNPINVIAGFAEILKSGIDQPDLAREAADAIYRNAQVQIKLITDLLDISRGIAGKLILDTKPMPLSSVLQEVLPSARDAAHKQGLELNVRSDSYGDLIQGDSVRISQVLWNLLSNAIKFTPKGGKIDLHLHRTDRWVELSVADTGPGIDPKFLPFMFERFNQQDASITKKFGGLGLGLAIVRHIVELHGGTVCAESAGPGQGATFTVRFPALTN